MSSRGFTEDHPIRLTGCVKRPGTGARRTPRAPAPPGLAWPGRIDTVPAADGQDAAGNANSMQGRAPPPDVGPLPEALGLSRREPRGPMTPRRPGSGQPGSGRTSPTAGPDHSGPPCHRHAARHRRNLDAGWPPRSQLQRPSGRGGFLPSGQRYGALPEGRGRRQRRRCGRVTQGSVINGLKLSQNYGLELSHPNSEAS